MFGLRNLASRVKSAFSKVRAAATVPQATRETIPVVTRRAAASLAVAAALDSHTRCHGYIPPSFEFAHVTGKRGHSLKQRSNRRKAKAKAR